MNDRYRVSVNLNFHNIVEDKMDVEVENKSDAFNRCV